MSCVIYLVSSEASAKELRLLLPRQKKGASHRLVRLVPAFELLELPTAV